MSPRPRSRMPIESFAMSRPFVGAALAALRAARRRISRARASPRPRASAHEPAPTSPRARARVHEPACTPAKSNGLGSRHVRKLVGRGLEQRVRMHGLEPRPAVRRRGLGRASLCVVTNLPSAGKPAPTSPNPRAHEPTPTSPRPRARAHEPTRPRPRARAHERARFSACTQCDASRSWRHHGIG